MDRNCHDSLLLTPSFNVTHWSSRTRSKVSRRPASGWIKRVAGSEFLLNSYRSQVNSTNLDCRDSIYNRSPGPTIGGSHMEILLKSRPRQALVQIFFDDCCLSEPGGHRIRREQVAIENPRGGGEEPGNDLEHSNGHGDSPAGNETSHRSNGCSNGLTNEAASNALSEAAKETIEHPDPMALVEQAIIASG
jgi:hypothetical protein